MRLPRYAITLSIKINARCTACWEPQRVRVSAGLMRWGSGESRELLFTTHGPGGRWWIGINKGVDPAPARQA